MTIIQETNLQNLLNQCDIYSLRQQKQAKQAVNKRIDQINKIICNNIRNTFKQISLDILVRFMQISVQINDKFVYAEQFIQHFFQRVQNNSQFYIRALLVKAKMVAYNGHFMNHKGEKMLQTLKQAITFINKALDLICGPQQSAPKGKDSKGGGAIVENSKVRYSFLIYNTSTCVFKIIRFMLRPNWFKHFIDIIERIHRLLEELDEPDHNWRCKFTLIYFQCLYDSDKKADAWKVLDLLWEKTKNKHCQFQNSLFKLRVHYSKQNNALSGTIKKDIEGADPNGWKVIQVLQRINSGVIPEAQIEKQLMGIINQISLGVLSSGEQVYNSKISPILLESLAWAGRIALKFNIINIANSITIFLTKTLQNNQKAMILNEYNKAQLLIKKKGDFIDKKTGMMMSAIKMKNVEIECRKEALQILQKVMIINRKIENPELIYQGSILIWNTSLPFMCPQYREYIIKSFDISCILLEQIDSVDHELRTKMHLQLAKCYFHNQLMFSEVQNNIMKAIKLDHTIPLNKIPYKFESYEDPSLYHRPYERYLNNFKQKIMLKTMQNENPSELDLIMQDLWNVADQKSDTTRMDILQKSLKSLLSIEENDFKIIQQEMLVDEEIKQKKIQYDRIKLANYKKKKMLASQVAEYSFEWQFNQFAKKACQFVLVDKWQAKNSIELIIAQVKCSYFLGQIKIDQLAQRNFQVPFQDGIKIHTEQNDETIVNKQEQQEINSRKKEIIQCFSKGLTLAEMVQQHWLVFNGAIYIWNNFLHLFRNRIHNLKLRQDFVQLLGQLFETMRNSLKEIEKKNIVYYDIDTKIQTFANISLIYARLMENKKEITEVVKICEALLLTPLSPQMRKMVNSIKARVNNSKNAPPQGKTDPKKGANTGQKPGEFNDNFLFEIVSQLEVIQNSTNKAEVQNLIKKCYQSLQSWQPKQKDQTELQLHTQMWVRLGRLALNENNVQMFKYSLKCVEASLLFLNSSSVDLNNIPANRLRWYSLAQFIYSENLLKLVNPESQETQSLQKLLFSALNHAVQSGFKGYKSKISTLVLDASKQVWNICTRLQSSQQNRAKLMKPIKTILFYMKQMKEQSEIDLILLLSQLYFKSALENEQFKAGEDLADMLFCLVPKKLQKSLWEAKMIFLSKQGKNQLQAISNIREADPSLQAKLWIKLARVASQPSKQHSAYNKAIDILKKQNSVEIVQVLIEYAEWQLRVGKQQFQTISSTLLLAADYLIDIEYGEQQQDGDDQNSYEKATIFSRSSRGKKSQVSKNLKIINRDKAKQAIDKKGTISIKSKNSVGVSRMNRSGRTTKTIKSKNVKSIFTNKQQQSNPQSLNCIHFQRLFRIHTILAIISPDIHQRIRYALDSKQFLIKMYEISLKTLNEMQENAAKFSEKENKNDEIKKIQLPKSIVEWINFQLPKVFTQKIKNFQSTNFMGIYTFEKPELTFTYIRQLIRIFHCYGYNSHIIPLCFFAHFIAKYIMQNDTLVQWIELMLKNNLQNLCQTTQKLPFKFNLDSLKITDNDKKNQEKLSISHKSIHQNDNLFLSTKTSPNLVKIIPKHQCWFQIGKLLIEFGETAKSKLYLQQALKNAKILNSYEIMGQIYLYISLIGLLEGQKKIYLQNILKVNKYCKSSRNWQKFIYIFVQIMLNVQKYNQCKNLLIKMKNSISDLILQCQNGHKDVIAYTAQLIELKSLLITIKMHQIYIYFIQIIDDHGQKKQYIESFDNNVKDYQNLLQIYPIWNLKHYNFIIKLINSIFKLYQNGGGIYHINLNLLTFQQLLNILIKIEKNIFNFLKYTFIGELANQYDKNQLNQLHKSCRFLLVKGYIIKHIIITQEINTNLNQNISDENQNAFNHQAFKKFMNTLNKQIKKKISPIPVNLEPIQTAIAILLNLETQINPNTYQYVIWNGQYAYAQTLRAIYKQQLIDLWQKNQDQIQEGQKNQIDKAYAIQSLQATLKYSQNCENKSTIYWQNQECYYYAHRAYEALMENRGKKMSESFLQYIVKYQHAAYTESVIKLLQTKLSKNHRFLASLRLINNTTLNGQKKQKILKNDKLYQAFNIFPNYNQCLNLLPKNSVIIILQFNSNKSELYFCRLINGKQDSFRSIECIKHNIQKQQIKIYLQIKQNIIKIKKNMLKTPFEQQNKQIQYIKQYQNILNKQYNKFISLCKWWLNDLINYLNISKQNINEQIQNKDKDKKGGKDTKKKGGKDQLGSYESSLPATASGIESITYLLDDFLFSLPYEILPGLQHVPAIGKDSSLFYFTRKLQQNGFQSEINNSFGFTPDKAKYFCYDFKDQLVNFKTISSQIMNQSTNIKFQGINSTTRIPSLGDFKRNIAEQGFIQFYGIPQFFNQIKYSSLIQCIGSCKSKLWIIMDRLNYSKFLLNKFINLNQQGSGAFMQQQQSMISCIANLLNVCIIHNRWSSNSSKMKEIILQIYQKLGKGQYIGSINYSDKLIKNKEQSSELLYNKMINYVIGPPILRL